MIALLLALSAAADGTIHRCGLELLPSGWKASAPPAFDSSLTASPRTLAAGTQSLLTRHFAIYWTTTGTNAILTGNALGSDPREIGAGDSVPALVRSAATGLEAAWARYVDTLGYAAPKAMPMSYLWHNVPPGGRYPVELCNIGAIYKANGVFGLTFPYTNGSSQMLLGSNIATFNSTPNWSFAPDTSASAQTRSDYSRNWDTVMRATAAHELFHSVQFNYEVDLSHFLFEASAVAMEKEVVPEEQDYLFFLDPDNRGLANLASLLPLTAEVDQDNISRTYDHAWYVKQLMQDRGSSVLRDLWESRRSSQPPIRSTLRAVLDRGPTTYDSSLARYALRLALTGRRSRWLLPEFASFEDARLFPTLVGTIGNSSSPRSVPLASGAVQAWIDTAGTSADRIVAWLPDAGAALRHAWMDGSSAGSEWIQGPVRQSASSTRRDAWALANPGPREALRAFARVDSARPMLWTTSAPARTSAHGGAAFTWSSGSSSLEGTAQGDAACTPLLFTDIWTPIASEDPTAAAVAERDGGHALVLADADRVLSLSGAKLSLPFSSVGTVLVDRGDGAWISARFSTSSTGIAVDLGSLSLSTPLRLVLAPGAAPAGSVKIPRPNPSRNGAPIHFPLAGNATGATLDILSQDGQLIRRLVVPDGATDMVWDVRNGSGGKVRPAVYWYVWKGLSGSTRGRLLVAD